MIFLCYAQLVSNVFFGHFNLSFCQTLRPILPRATKTFRGGGPLFFYYSFYLFSFVFLPLSLSLSLSLVLYFLRTFYVFLSFYLYLCQIRLPLSVVSLSILLHFSISLFANNLQLFPLPIHLLPFVSYLLPVPKFYISYFLIHLPIYLSLYLSR